MSKRDSYDETLVSRPKVYMLFVDEDGTLHSEAALVGVYSNPYYAEEQKDKMNLVSYAWWGIQEMTLDAKASYNNGRKYIMKGFGDGRIIP